MATTLPCLQMARELSSLKIAVWSPILSAPNIERKKKKKNHVCSRQAYNVNFLWEKEKVVGIQEPFGIENIIYIYIKQDLQSSLEHTVFRWCAPYVTICTTQLRLLVVWLCDVGCDSHMHYCVDSEHAYNFLVNCLSVCVVENMKLFSVCHLNSLVLFTLFRNWWSL